MHLRARKRGGGKRVRIRLGIGEVVVARVEFVRVRCVSQGLGMSCLKLLAFHNPMSQPGESSVGQAALRVFQNTDKVYFCKPCNNHNI